MNLNSVSVKKIIGCQGLDGRKLGMMMQTRFAGVIATRSHDRPNPLHRADVLEIKDPGRIRVRPLEALDGTPIIDIKPVLPGVDER